MKKTILVGMIATLMLFAFAGCNNQPMAGVEEMVTEISITSETPSFFKGDKVEATDFTVTAKKVSGETAVVNPQYLEFDFDDTKVKDGALVGTSVSEDVAGKIGTVRYTGATYGTGTVSADIYAYVFTMDEITVSGSETEPYYGAATDVELRTDAYTVTGIAKDDDGEIIYSRELTSSEYTPSVDAVASNTSFADVTFTAASTFQTSAAITAAEKPRITLLPDYIVSIVATQKEGTVAYVRGTAGEASNWVTLTATYRSGKENPLTGTVKYADEEFTATSEFTADPVIINIEYTAGYGEKNEKWTGEVTINPAPDKLISFTVSPGTVSVGETLVASNFKVATQTWASTKTAAPEGVELDSLLQINGGSQVTIPAYAASKAYPLTFSLIGYDVVYQTTVTPVAAS